MRIGLSTPVVVQVPGVASDWESTGTIDDLARIALNGNPEAHGLLRAGLAGEAARLSP